MYLVSQVTCLKITVTGSKKYLEESTGKPFFK